MSRAVLGALCGGGAGLGLVVVALRVPRWRRPVLDDRLQPYLRDAPRQSRLLSAPTGSPLPVLMRILGPLLGNAARALGRFLGGREVVQRRLARAGMHTSVESFRLEQLVWGLASLLVAMAASLLLFRTGVIDSPLVLLLLCFAAAIGGVLARDTWLSSAIARRERQMLAELPTVAELLALAVAAGEGPAAALERVTRVLHGELAGEIRHHLAASRSGTPLISALRALSAATALAPVARFVDGIVIALERGTPLADVLRAQAMDVRESGKRRLLETGGRKEVGMMIPVIFVVLPVTVLFALFPGYISLSLTA